MIKCLWKNFRMLSGFLCHKITFMWWVAVISVVSLMVGRSSTLITCQIMCWRLRLCKDPVGRRLLWHWMTCPWRGIRLLMSCLIIPRLLEWLIACAGLMAGSWLVHRRALLHTMSRRNLSGKPNLHIPPLRYSTGSSKVKKTFWWQEKTVTSRSGTTIKVTLLIKIGETINKLKVGEVIIMM